MTAMENGKWKMENLPRQIGGANGLPSRWGELLRGLVFALVVLMLGVPLFGQTYDPLGYWRFENPNRWADSSGSGYGVIFNPGQLLVGNTDPVAGQYYSARDWSPAPGVSWSMDSLASRMEISLELWVRFKPGHYDGSVFWDGKCQLGFSSERIYWAVGTATGYRQIIVDLWGVGPADPHYLFDNDWHHIAAVYSSMTGEQRMYVDGVCPPGFFVHHGVGGPINDGGVFSLTYSGVLDHLIADLDEMAVYDTVIPPQLVWEHYQRGLAGLGYDFTVQSAVATYPFPVPVQENERNLLEFAPGYPNVVQTPLELFGTYPLPRYLPTDSIRPLIPWMADAEPFRFGPVAQSNYEASIIMERLAHEWNYYLFAGVTHGNYRHVRNPLNWSNPTLYINDLVRSLNAPINAGMPRFMISNWPYASRRGVDPSYPDPIHQFAFVNNPFLPDSTFYIHDSTLATMTQPLGPIALDGWSLTRLNYGMGLLPSYRLDSLGVDGQMQRVMIDTFMQYLNDPYLDMLGENDEQIALLDPAFVYRDREITRDYHANFSGWPDRFYQGFRGTQMRWAYQTPWLAYLQSINTIAGRPAPQAYWYSIFAEDHAYGVMRDILQFNEPRKRATPFFYPNAPQWWRHGRGSITGIDQQCHSLRSQLSYGDSLWIPAVSPGFNAGFTYVVDDIDMERPGQFLGQLKAMACMGAESYAIFMLHVGAIPVSQGNWRTWQMPMLSYAQGVTSRFQRFLYHGEVLVGDTTFTSYGSTPTFYTFSTGNEQDLITGRKLYGEHQYLVSASAQRTYNMQSQGPKSKLVSFRLHDNAGNGIFNPFIIEERLQGSTYVLDRRNPAAPVFYQLDRWHEWKEPARWCRDFDWEAEVWDSAAAGTVILTERPVPASSGDFSAFTSYIKHAPLGWSQYWFRPTGADQDTLYLWVRARNNDAIPRFVQARVDTGAFQQVRVQPDTVFGWHGRGSLGQPVVFSVLDTTVHVLELLAVPGLDIDRVVLLRGDEDVSLPGVSAAAVIIDNSICLGDSAELYSEFGCTGCTDVVWDFGDGTVAYGDVQRPYAGSCENRVRHMYQYPGDYVVTMTVTSLLFEQSATDTVHVHVRAPHVDAGNDTLMCADGSVVLQGDALPLFQWAADTSLSSTTVLNPVATPDSSQYFYLTATDAAGCSMTDSVWVTVVRIDTIRTPDSLWVCPGGSVQLSVQGAWFVDWSPSTGLSAANVPNPIATPAATTVYYFRASDVCRCDTVYGSVTVVVRGIVDDDTTICANGAAVLHATGTGPWLWVPSGATTQTVTVSPPVSTTYVLHMDSTGGCDVDSVRVTVNPYNCCGVAGVQNYWYRERASDHLPGLIGGVVHIVDTFFVDVNWAASGTTFWLDSMAVIYVLPGVQLTTANCTFQNACPWMWSGVKLASGTSRQVSFRDIYVNAWRGVWSRNGAPFDVRSGTFKGCWVGIYVGRHGGSLTPPHPGVVQGSLFTDSPLLPPFAGQPWPWAGVLCDTVISGFTLGVPGGSINTFERLQHGLLAVRSTVNVYNNTFRFMQAGTVAPWLGLGAGVRVVAPVGSPGTVQYSATVGHGTSTVSSVLSQHQNSFLACRYGVHVLGTGTVRVRGNQYNFNRKGTFVRDVTQKQVLIDYNAHASDSLAIFVGQCSNINGHVDLNKVSAPPATGVFHGIRCDMVTLPPTSNVYPFRVKENTIKLRGNGIWVQACRQVNVVDNTVVLSPVSAFDKMRGITVNSGTRDRVNLNHVSGNTLAATMVSVAGVHVFASPTTMVTCNWTTSVGNHVVWEGFCDPSDFKGNIMDTGVNGLVYLNFGRIGTQGASGAPSDNQWLGNFSSAHTHSFSSDGMLSRLYIKNIAPFIPTFNLNTSGVSMVPILVTFPNPYSCPTPFLAASKVPAIDSVANLAPPVDAYDAAMQYRAREWAYEELVEDSSLMLGDTVIQSFHAATAGTDLGGASRANLNLVVPDTALATLETNLVNAVDDILYNHKEVQVIREVDAELDSSEIAQLLVVAAQCEELGGKAVNIARSMLAVEGIMLWDDPECEEPYKLEGNSQSSGNLSADAVTAECWPNPTNGRLFLRFNKGEVVGIVKVYGNQGQALMSQGFDYEGQPIEVDASGWSQGLLLVHVETVNGELFTWRILLQR